MKLPGILKDYTGFLSKGLIIELAPEIAKGFLVEMFKAKGTNVKGVSNWVQNNTTLWDTLEPDEQMMIKELAERAGSIDWLDDAWVIDAIRIDFPAVASLLLGWKKANNWLKRQAEIIRQRVVE